MTILYFLIVSYMLLSLSLYTIFKKLGYEPWKALVPGLNFIKWCEIIGRPSWWALFLLIPIVNIFIYAGMCVDMVQSFKKYSFWDSALAVVYAPISFFNIGWNKNINYGGPSVPKERNYAKQLEEAYKKGNDRLVKKLRTNSPYHKSAPREWVEAIVFAVFAAAFIRMFTIEAYAIPTSSMEGSLLIGDHLFVSKLHYGMRTPSTVAMIPLLHNRIPFLEKESYIEKPNLPAYRFPAIEKINHYDPVVFNMPEGDSVYVTPGRTWSVYDFRRNTIPTATAQQIQLGKYPLVTRPIDKIDHYVKHCVATPGDNFQIIDRQVHINGTAIENPTHIQFRYLVIFDKKINDRKFEEWGISKEDQTYYNASGEGYRMLIMSNEQKKKVQAMDASIQIIPNDMYWVNFPGNSDKTLLTKWGIGAAHIRATASAERSLMTLTKTQVAALKAEPTIKVENYDESDRLFPHDPAHFGGWTVDNYGPLWVPKAGETLDLRLENIAAYRRIIEVYENNDFAIKNGEIYINGKVSTQYTFKLDYYWMMGDNRHNSEDSRMWGFVPETHIVGKPLFLFFSTKNNQLSDGIYWDRILTSASKK